MKQFLPLVLALILLSGCGAGNPGVEKQEKYRLCHGYGDDPYRLSQNKTARICRRYWMPQNRKFGGWMRCCLMF